MRNSRTIIFVVAIVVITQFISCKDNDDSLPPLTTSGKGTFGCLINGKLWVPSGSYSGTHADMDYTSIDTVRVDIYGYSGQPIRQIAMTVFDTPAIVVNKDYHLNEKGIFAIYTNVSNSISCEQKQVTDGYVRFSKFEPSSNVISGIFQFTVSGNSCNGQVNVTQGRFDIGEINF
jgi:hypothetical protein